MVKQLLDEVRSAPLDEKGRARLAEIHQRSIAELEDGLAPELVEELERITLPFQDDSPSDAELRIAQAQLVGWLEGLFHGIQTAFVAQQMAAQAQLQQMRQLPPGHRAPGDADRRSSGDAAPAAPAGRARSRGGHRSVPLRPRAPERSRGGVGGRPYSERMDVPPPTMDRTMFDAPLRDQLDAFLEDHRQILTDCLDGMTEEQARRRLVPSKTTLLSLLKHATFVERVWFDEAVTAGPGPRSASRRRRTESFDVDDDDTVASVLASYRAACDDSRRSIAGARARRRAPGQPARPAAPALGHAAHAA